jgi:hypothetical protein
MSSGVASRQPQGRSLDSPCSGSRAESNLGRGQQLFQLAAPNETVEKVDF